MARVMVIAAYRPKPGKDAALLEIVRDHVATLRRAGLATDRPAVLMRASDATLLEVFEWAREDASSEAHTTPEVARIWEAMMEIAEFPAPAGVAGMDGRFPHFEPVDGVVS